MKLDLCGQLDDYLDGELGSTATSAFEEHVERCALCRRAVKESRAVEQLVERAFELERSAGFTMESMGVAHAAFNFQPASMPGRWRVISVRCGKIAACFAAVAALVLIWTNVLSYLQDATGVLPQSTHIAQMPKANSPPAPHAPATASDIRSVDIHLAEDQKLLAVRMPTHNERVTIVWMYPTVQ